MNGLDKELVPMRSTQGNKLYNAVSSDLGMNIPDCFCP